MPTMRFAAVVIALSMTTNAAAAGEPMADVSSNADPRTESSRPGSYQIHGFAEYRYGLRYAKSFAHGIEYSHRAQAHVRLGAALSLPFRASSVDYCYAEDPPDCAFNYIAPIAFVEAHARPDAPFDPWVRAAVGLAFMYSRWEFYEIDGLEIEGLVSGSLGFDIHAGPVVVGAYGTAYWFTGEHVPVFGPGMRLGGQF
ncbi:hypothetical protein [Polyangium sp. 15x6]|uniref:hypothetical protein n=1 Tax=Polyangium sp. 15x6 TaxID=3042687 RepID=UPI00249AAD0E|nr:hypothetical protein [Polyangium sp. 15x6]MDI3284545.1 hypothetical protein [Polyangium sp. 15x6]